MGVWALVTNKLALEQVCVCVCVCVCACVRAWVYVLPITGSTRPLASQVVWYPTYSTEYAQIPSQPRHARAPALTIANASLPYPDSQRCMLIVTDNAQVGTHDHLHTMHS